MNAIFEEGYTSAWLDEKPNIIRFCGDKEILADMSSEILKYLPHYYVIGVRFVRKQ